MIEVFAQSLRMIIWSAAMQLVTLFAGRELLGQKRSLLPAYLFGVLKMAGLILWRERIALQPDIVTEEIMIQVTATYLTNIITFSLFVWTFSDTLAKRLLGTFVSETYGIIIGDLALIIEGLLLGYKDLLDVRTRFRPADLILPLLCFGLWAVFRPVSRRILRRYRRLKFKHENIITIAIIIYFTIQQIADAVGALNGNQITYRYLLEMQVIFLLFAVAVNSIAIRNEERAAKQQNSLLVRQLQIITRQYSAIQDRYDKTRRLLKFAETQMEQLEKKMQSGTHLESEELAEYAAELKNEYRQISGRFFCQDPQIDAVLCYEREALSRNNTEAQFYLEQYMPGRVTSEDITILLYTICEEFSEQASAVSEKSNLTFNLNCGTINGQLIIRFDRPVQGKWNKTRKRILKETVRKYNGSIWLYESGRKHMDECIIRIPNDRLPGDAGGV